MSFENFFMNDSPEFFIKATWPNIDVLQVIVVRKSNQNLHSTSIAIRHGIFGKTPNLIAHKIAKMTYKFQNFILIAFNGKPK